MVEIPRRLPCSLAAPCLPAVHLPPKLNLNYLFYVLLLPSTRRSSLSFQFNRFRVLSLLLLLRHLFLPHTQAHQKKKEFISKNKNKRPGRSLTSHWLHLLRFISSNAFLLLGRVVAHLLTCSSSSSSCPSE